MIDKKVPRPLRDWVPLLARGDRVLWAVGVALSQQAAIGDNTAETFRLEWEREELSHES
jgi:tRNA(Ile)-lysidine synthase